ncbi:MAG: SDR family oxidoreductase [Gemmatimonadota bacterium]
MTGYPGFLGEALLPRLLRADPDVVAHCLVQGRFRAEAERARRALEPAAAARVHLVEGDITRPGLGLTPDSVPEELSAVWHLAALYDLDASAERCHPVNVTGTAHVLGWLATLPGAPRLHYVSTCYVSGTHTGVFREEELELGQGFKNAYEASKHAAEVLVRRAMDHGLAATVYRPGIVVGDSATGATRKYDGPYHVIRMLLRQPRLAVVPVPGGMAAATVNVVPRDFVVTAMVALAARADSAGRTYHLAHPAPPSAAEMLGMLARATGRVAVPVRVPGRLARGLLRRSALLRRLLLPPGLLDYFTHPVRHDTTHAARDLADSGIAPPDFAAYVDRLVAYVRAHPEVGAEAMV